MTLQLQKFPVTSRCFQHTSKDQLSVCHLRLPRKDFSDYLKSKPKKSGWQVPRIILQGGSQHDFYWLFNFQKLIWRHFSSYSYCRTNLLIGFLKFPLLLQIGVHILEYSALWNPFIPTEKEALKCHPNIFSFLFKLSSNYVSEIQKMLDFSEVSWWTRTTNSFSTKMKI